MKAPNILLAAALGVIVRAGAIVRDVADESTRLETARRPPERPRLEVRQSAAVGSVANELVDGKCRDVIFIFARGTAETGNMGTIIGPALGNALKDALGEVAVAVQGLDYAADVASSTLPGGCSPATATSLEALLERAAKTCPSAGLVVGGFSQGAAALHRALERAPAGLRARVRAAVTFGDSQRARDGAVIPNFPPDRTAMFCNDGDHVCHGSLFVTFAHLNYLGSVGPAVQFIKSKL